MINKPLPNTRLFKKRRQYYRNKHNKDKYSRINKSMANKLMKITRIIKIICKRPINSNNHDISIIICIYPEKINPDI